MRRDCFPTMLGATSLSLLLSLKSFGLILLEAMRMSKPVVATRVGGMVDIVEDGGNGLVVEPGNVDELRAAISRLAGSAELREKFGLRSRQLFVERYSVVKMVEGMVAEYRRVSDMPRPALAVPVGA